jgi:hypothetical protein
VNERGVNTDALCHVPERYPIEAILREEVLGRVEDLFDAFGTLFRLAAAWALVPGGLSHAAATIPDE